MAPTARDVMQSDVLCVSPETPLLEVQRLFVDEEITGAPVTDAGGRLEGVISTTDLMRAAGEEPTGAAGEAKYFRDGLELSGLGLGLTLEEFQDRLGERCAADVMTRGGVSVAPEASIAEVAATLRLHRIHRVLVVEDERLVGIISSFDLVALLEEQP